MTIKYDKVLDVIREDDLDGGTIAVDASFTGNVIVGDAITDTLTINSQVKKIILDNAVWLQGLNNAENANINMFKVNTSDEIDLGAVLNIGPMELEEDSGEVTLINLPVSATPADETVEGYTLSVDSNSVVKILASADSAGGVYGERLKINSSIFLNDAQTFVDSDATPDVRGYSNWETNTTTATITDFDWGGKTIPEGQLLIVVSKGAITYDVTGQGIVGGTTDIVTAAGDVTTFLYDGADWLVTSRIDASDDLN